jgi:hypothetical protein
VSTSIELANVGGDDLVLNELRLAYANPAIELSWGGADTLPAGASAELSIDWSPVDDVWELESKLRIGSNDPDRRDSGFLIVESDDPMFPILSAHVEGRGVDPDTGT